MALFSYTYVTDALWANKFSQRPCTYTLKVCLGDDGDNYDRLCCFVFNILRVNISMAYSL